jgi:hypothetical protein
VDTSPQASHDEIKELALACFLDPVLFCKTFLGHLFPGDIPWVHRGLLAILTEKTGFLTKYGELEKIVKNFVYLDSSQKERQIFQLDSDGKVTMFWRPYIEIMLPRGFSKTTYAGISIPLYRTLYQTIKFGVNISEAADHAIMQMENVRRELSENERIIQVFGELKPRLRDDEKWSAKMFETTTGVAFVARGRGAQVRGLNHRGNRPQEILVDDVEDKESVETETQREKTRRWFYSDVMPALPTVGRGRIVAIGTMLHPEGLLNTLANDERWSVVRFGVKDRDGDWLWPAAVDEAKDRATKKSYAAAGQLGSYYMEYHNEPRSEETAMFKREWFKYGEPSESDKIVAAATYCDPAISEKESADEAVVITVLMTDRGKIFITDGWGKYGPSQDDINTEFFRQHRIRAGKEHASFAGIENNGFQAALEVGMRQAMFQMGYYFNLEGVTHSQKKYERIKGVLQPRFQNGFMYFTRKFPKLEAQLLDYQPKQDQEDDWPDALAGAVKLLAPMSPFYMEEKEYDDSDDVEDPYGEKNIPDLRKEIGGSWEVA